MSNFSYYYYFCILLLLTNITFEMVSLNHNYDVLDFVSTITLSFSVSKLVIYTRDNCYLSWAGTLISVGPLFAGCSLSCASSPQVATDF